MARRLIGEVSHYFTNIGVAVLELTTVLRQGETIEFEKRDRTWGYKQKARSMELEHKKVKEAKKGSSIGMKVNKPVKKGFRVYKVAATTAKAPVKKVAKKPVAKKKAKCPPKRKCGPPKRKSPSKRAVKRPVKRAAKKVVKKTTKKVARKPVRKTTRKR